MAVFLIFRSGFRSSRSVADLLTFPSDRTGRSGTTLHKLKFYGISVWVFGLIFSFLRNRQLWFILDGKSLQKWSVDAGVPRGSIRVVALFLLDIKDILGDVICIMAIYTDDTTPYTEYDWGPGLWEQTRIDF